MACGAVASLRSVAVTNASVGLRNQNADGHKRKPDDTDAKRSGIDGDQKLHPVFGFLAFRGVFFELKRHAHRIAKADKAERGENSARINQICKDIFHAGCVAARKRFGKLGLAPRGTSG